MRWQKNTDVLAGLGPSLQQDSSHSKRILIEMISTKPLCLNQTDLLLMNYSCKTISLVLYKWKKSYGKVTYFGLFIYFLQRDKEGQVRFEVKKITYTDSVPHHTESLRSQSRVTCSMLGDDTYGIPITWSIKTRGDPSKPKKLISFSYILKYYILVSRKVVLI